MILRSSPNDQYFHLKVPNENTHHNKKGGGGLTILEIQHKNKNINVDLIKQ